MYCIKIYHIQLTNCTVPKINYKILQMNYGMAIHKNTTLRDIL